MLAINTSQEAKPPYKVKGKDVATVIICMINLTTVIQLISQLRGYFYVNPILALSLAITIFSFVGVPPLVGFFAKQMVLSAALDSGYVFLSLVAILTSVVGAVYVCPLIIITPGSLNLTFETLKFIGYKPVNLSDFEMNRGVQHVDKESILSFYHYHIYN